MRKFTISTICAWSVLTLCVVVLIGWQFDIIELRSLLVDAPQTTPITAVMLLTLSLVLIIYSRLLSGEIRPRWIWIGRALAGATVLVALWMGIAYIFRLGPSIEIVLYPKLVERYGGAFPGRSSPQTIVSVFLLGLSVCLLPTSSQRVKQAALVFALLGMVIPWFALFGYVSTINPLYKLDYSPETGISPLTLIGLLALGTGAIALQPNAGLLRLVATHSVGGRIVTRLLPFALIAPLFLGWLVSTGHDAGFLDAVNGFALSWGLTSVVFAALVVWQGVTLNQYETMLKQQADALRESNHDLQQFAYVVSHDLRAPVNNVGLFLQLLQQVYHSRLDKDGNEWITHSLTSIQHMQALIRNILAYSSVNASKRAFEPVALLDLLNEIKEILGTSIQESSAEVICDALPTVTGDRVQLIQLLQNLVGNALKYRGDRTPRIHVSADRREGKWRISVQDNGIGIQPQYQERIFEVFERLHTQKKYTGTGIGLATCRRIVERHGGEIWVESITNQGSTFYFTIPDRKEET